MSKQKTKSTQILRSEATYDIFNNNANPIGVSSYEDMF